MSLPSDHYRRKNEAERKAATAATVEARKREWRDAGLLDDIARQQVVEVNPELWQGKPWWVQRRWVRWGANGLFVFAVAGMVRAVMQAEAFALAFWIPLTMAAFQLCWHIGRHGG